MAKRANAARKPGPQARRTSRPRAAPAEGRALPLPKLFSQVRRAPERINLALQGGGAHGAFTWGVLDRLLEDGRLSFPALSGTSAGAVNAVAFATGMVEGGREGARAKLEEVWRAVSQSGCCGALRTRPPEPDGAAGAQVDSAAYTTLDLMTRVFSPYDLNPLDVDPLRDVLAQSIDFKALRREGAPELYIAATEVATGSARIFTSSEISLNVVLASACLPMLRKAVKIGRHHYWDGGFSANPPLLPLVRASGAEDTLLVLLTPLREPELPTKAQDIIGQVNNITFNQPLRREIELIEQGRGRAGGGLGLAGRESRSLRRHRFHLIDATKHTRGLGQASKLSVDWEMLCYLRDGGRKAASRWLRQNLSDVGRRGGVDLFARFL